MANWSDLFGSTGGGGSALPYAPGHIYPAFTGPSTFNLSVNTDYLVPFSPRVDVTVGKVAWGRAGMAADSARVGIYSYAGVLLTDCAADSDATPGWHGVDTTPVELLQGSTYWLALNTSSSIARAVIMNAATAHYSPGIRAALTYGYAANIGTVSFGAGAAQQKSRTHAALLATLTMSGWFVSDAVPLVGIIPA